MSRIRGRKATNDSSSNNNNVVPAAAGRKKQKTINFDDQIDSDQESDYDEDRGRFNDDDDDVEEEETLDAKKVRLAREYLQKLESKDGSDEDSDSDDDGDENDDETDHDRVGVKLQRERLKREGALERVVADKVHDSLNRIRSSLPSSSTTFQQEKEATITTMTQQKQLAEELRESGHIKLLRGHDLTPTCVALQHDGKRAISGSKDHSVIIWDVQEERRAITLCPSWKKESADEKEATPRTLGEVLSVACSDDGRYAAVGRRDSTVCIYDIRAKTSSKSSLVKTFTGHKGPITCLSFRSQSLQLFSGSEDRCIRHYNLNEMMYLETLYGHQFGVVGVDCHLKERPVSVGRDRTARTWKLAEDTHMIYRGGAKIAPADSVRVMKEDWFLTGHEDGNLGLWMADKKRAVININQAHGAASNIGRGINAISSLRGSDLAMTGSYDGYLRLWKVMMGKTLKDRSIEPLDEIPLTGYVNDIAIGPKARFCVVAVGQEPKLGRWNRISGAKNRFGIIRLRSEEDIEAEDDIIDDEDQEPSIHSDEERNDDSDSD
ncbi:MAG: ribosomal RNA-processing protein 9 [Bacillariaceae sp.]|jgi:ribosomal RNA-processing protein 9